MNWIEALKQWNSGRPQWTIPKKGTPEYEDVIAMVTQKIPRAPKVFNPANDFDALDNAMEAMNRKKEAKAKKDAKNEDTLKKLAIKD
jgi:hypothetical protein